MNAVERYAQLDRRWKDHTVMSLFRDLGSNAQKRNSVKLGLTLVVLWILNWIY